jgi:hypothetical protein
VGVPSLTGAAVKVIDVPAQIDPEGLAVILTLAGSNRLIVTDLITCDEGPLQPLAVTRMLTVP